MDGTVRRRTTEYDGAGRPYLFTSYLSTGTTVANQVRRDYNGFGQLVIEYQEHTTSVNTATSPKVQYAYSETESGSKNHSRLTSITYPNGRVLSLTYAGGFGLDEAISRVSSLEETGTAVPLEAYDYLGLSTIVQRRRPQPGSDLTYYGTGATGDAGDQYAGLDRFGRVVDQWWKKGTTDTDRFKYGYDEDSNRTWKDVLGTGQPGGMDEAYFYDSLNRLTRVNRGNLASNTITDTNATWYQSWTLDALGNWKTFNDNGTSQTRTFNARNQLTSITGLTTPTYDNNGNTTHDETGKKFIYDAWDRVVGLDANNDGDLLDTGDVVYKYDALDQRISEERVGGTTTHLFYSSDSQVLEEQQGASTMPTVQNVWGMGYVDAIVLRDRDVVAGGNLGKTASGLDERTYAQQDANFNITSLVDTSGQMLERYQYAPYGSFTVLNGASGADKDGLVSDWTFDNGGTSDWGWIYLRQGGRYDSSSGNYHFRNRDFDPGLGTWNAADPLGFVDGRNLYEALKGNPVRFVDPFGTSCGECTQPYVGSGIYNSITSIVATPGGVSPDTRERGTDLLQALTNIALLQNIANIPAGGVSAAAGGTAAMTGAASASLDSVASAGADVSARGTAQMSIDNFMNSVGYRNGYSVYIIVEARRCVPCRTWCAQLGGLWKRTTLPPILVKTGSAGNLGSYGGAAGDPPLSLQNLAQEIQSALK